MQKVVADPWQHYPQHLGGRLALPLGRRQFLQKRGDLAPVGKTHVRVVGLVGAAGGGGGFREGHAGCHQRPASTTPAESSRFVPIMRSPIESA